MERLMNYLAEASEECSHVSFDIIIRDGYFVVDNISIFIEKDVEDFKYSEYRYFQSVAISIADMLNTGCSFLLEFFDEDDFQFVNVDVSSGDEDDYEYGIRIKELDLDDESRVVFYRDLLRFYMNVSIVNREIRIESLNMSDNLKQCKELVDFINSVVRLSKNKEDFIIDKVEPIKNAEEVVDLLVNDLKILYLTDYFDPFFDCNYLLKDKAVSIYHNNRVRERKDLINIFHQGYCFNWNVYKYYNEDIQSLYFSVVHSFEDLSWLNSTCSKYYDGPVDGHCLNGRGIREVKEYGHLGFDKIFYKYFTDSIIDILLEDVEFEIVLNKGKAESYFIDKENPDRVIGFNKLGEKVFSLSYDGNKMGITDLPIDDLLSQVNYLIWDINVRLKKLLSDGQTEELEDKEDPIKWDLEKID